MTPNTDAIRDREQAATPGPWVVRDQAGLRPWEVVISPTGRMVGLDWDATGKDDAAFIAAAREDVPALLAEVDRLRKVEKERDEARSALNRLALVRAYTNEDGKHFVFCDDVHEATR